MSVLEYVPDGTPLKCNFALSCVPAEIKVTNNRNVKLYGEKMASMADIVPEVNIPCFGQCKNGLKKCVPVPTKWENVSSLTTVSGNSYLLSDSYFMCGQGGKVEVDLAVTFTKGKDSAIVDDDSSAAGLSSNSTESNNSGNNGTGDSGLEDGRRGEESVHSEEDLSNLPITILNKTDEKGLRYLVDEELRRDVAKNQDYLRDNNDRTFADVGFECLADNPTHLMPGVDFMRGCFPPPKVVDGLIAIPRDFVISRGQDAVASVTTDLYDLGVTLIDLGKIGLEKTGEAIEVAPEVYENLSKASYEDYKEMGNAMLENLKELPGKIGDTVGEAAKGWAKEKWQDVKNAWGSTKDFAADPSALNGSILSTNVQKIIPEGLKRPVKTINEIIKPKQGKAASVDEQQARKKKQEEEEQKRKEEEEKRKKEQEIDDFDAENATNKERGNYGEIRATENLVDNPDLKDAGYDLERIGNPAPTSLDDKINKGIDGIYINRTPPPDYVIDEAKFNTARLGKTLDGKQMSDTWVKGSDRLADQVGPDMADDIMDALDNGTVDKIISRVDSNGIVTTKRLDAAGNIIGDFP
ncbi:PAAR-like protein [Sungkyunkwania multivorans]|uniref:PAAR-like protein n=1 Tax=Sungkyunkwania multivorans TaxID=1173618 RepID=A0ABW3D2Q5_9FLAO